jgi:DNA uptake protein ComE-like DNA-binding protein
MGRRRRRGWLRGKAWLLLTLPLGLTTWTAFLYIGIRARRPRWLVWSAFYMAVFATYWVVDSSHTHSTATAIASWAGLAVWVGGAIHAVAISSKAVRQIDERTDPLVEDATPALRAAEGRIERRAQGRKLLAHQPQLAKEVGVGRPDVPGADAYGLVDVNHAGEAALRSLPGITEEAAQKIVRMRPELGGFSSVEDLGAALDLPSAMVDEIRDVAIFVH